ncbi:class I SAM-dependent methyltransferase [Paenibacillus sediminis]|uniref:Ubiquinone/menaquinone biosynthesis C-methylase UbiE n=1 Tax=Paenibacillus sediminis TaxID=664909 RepID=A0ABS4H211_9BACL|nr:ubiquinone/menaquinone biosynthesis C-methylase UbiE [Paenibacillus sediminis]
MEKVIEYYNTFDEWGRLDREPIEFLVNCHYIKSNLPAKAQILDNGAGPGKYAIELAKLGHHVTLTDLTPRLVEIAKEKAIEQHLERQFDGFYYLDARDLSKFTDEQFDASLMLGPMYHLQSEEDRIQAVKELGRVTKKGGLVFVAFMSRIRHLTTSLMFPEHWKPNHTIEGISDFLESGIFNHSDDGRFTGAYYFDIEHIKTFMESHGFESVKLIGSESIAGAMNREQWDYWRHRGDEEFQRVMQIIIDAAGSPYILGTSSHLLYIGRKL